MDTKTFGAGQRLSRELDDDATVARLAHAANRSVP
jgi:hypothetical protein